LIQHLSRPQKVEMETSSGQFCPICKFKNEPDASICVYCGASLEGVWKGDTTTRRVNEEKKIIRSQTGDLNKELIPPKGIAIYTTEGELVGIWKKNEFFLGRKLEGSDEGYVDLTSLGAFQKGVSRRHAVIRQIKRGYEIADLESTNGTFIDGKRLVSNRPYTLPSASRVTLGRMHLLVLYLKITTKNKTPK
jgi:hypothetical protein